MPQVDGDRIFCQVHMTSSTAYQVGRNSFMVLYRYSMLVLGTGQNTACSPVLAASKNPEIYCTKVQTSTSSIAALQKYYTGTGGYYYALCSVVAL